MTSPSFENATSLVANAIALKMAQETDDALREAISNRLGTKDWMAADIAPRMRRVVHPVSDLEFFTLDGEPVFVLGPVKTSTGDTDGKTMFRASRGYKALA